LVRQKPFPADSRTAQNHCLHLPTDLPVPRVAYGNIYNVFVLQSIAAHRESKHENPLLFLLVIGVCAAPLSGPAQSSYPAAPASQPAEGIADAWAATSGVKSAEQIDKEWQDSTAKFDGRRNTLLKLADEQAHDGPYRPDSETLRSHEIPQWFRDAKFGIFISWGVSTLSQAR